MAADIDCLTKEQARAKWPGQWLYWHTENRCWDNQKVGARPRAHYSVNRNPLRLGKPPVDANGNFMHHSARAITQDEIDEMQYRLEAEKRLATCCWPPPATFLPWELRVTGAFQ